MPAMPLTCSTNGHAPQKPSVATATMRVRLDSIEKLREETRELVPANGYEEVISIRDEGEKVSILFKELKENLSEFVLITDRPNEFNIISIVGKITLQDIQNMVNDDKEE